MIDSRICPLCNSNQVYVYRTSGNNKRVRKCISCGYRYKTVELLETEYRKLTEERSKNERLKV